MNTIIDAQKDAGCFVGSLRDAPDVATFEWTPEVEALFPEQSVIPLRRPKRGPVALADLQEENDARLAQAAIDEDDSISYEAFRVELGLNE